MQHANKNSVLADFNEVMFESNRFYTKTYEGISEYWVNIKDKDGKFHDFQIKYTFGVFPLQQYMVEFEDGRIQLIPFAWDSRNKKSGGQHWFNLYPDQTQKHQEFFWTNTGQNWNYMCADCHSTNVSKNFDVDTNTYKTHFSEINVACEACHGPASDHITWTKNKKNIKHYGFNRNLKKQINQWQLATDSNTLQPKKVSSTQQVLVCAQCHSRRTQISDIPHINDDMDKNTFGERYLLDLISSENYHPDGQVYNEDFVYGSFLQSKMYQKGVVCSNCHEPHSGKLTQPIESICLQCHQSSVYAQKSHHHHEENTKGAQCVNCHMSQTTYMSIDARRDHSFSIPRPDLALQLKTPDTCLKCHDDKNSEWSKNSLDLWFPKGTPLKNSQPTHEFAHAFAASNFSLSEQQSQSLATELSRIAQTQGYAPIIRASALAKMTNVGNINSTIAIARAVKNKNEFIRLGAIQGATTLEMAEKWRVLSPLLTDTVLSVRISAAFALVQHWARLTTKQQDTLTPALNEYLTSQNFNNDRSFAHSNKGIVYAYQGQFKNAIHAFKQGIKIEPNFAQAYVNLSQVYRQLGKDNELVNVLETGIKANPSNADLPFQLGLAYVRLQDKIKASAYLTSATNLSPENSYYWYILGLTLEDQNKKQSYKALNKAFELSRNPQYLYALCDMQIRHKAFAAKQCISELEKIVPNEVIQRLKATMR